MKLSLLLLVGVLAVSAVAQTVNEADGGIIAERAGAVAGEKAGAAAGREAGASAGKQAGIEAIRNLTGTTDANKTDTSIGKAEAFTLADFDELTKKEPGASAFFQEYDKDGDKLWNQGEWTKAIQAAIEGKMLPKDFDVFGTWEQVPKNEQGKVNLRDFLTIAAKTKKYTEPNTLTAEAGSAGSLYKNCDDMFDKLDKNHDGGLDLDEFRVGVSGKIDNTAVADQYQTLPRNGPGATLDVKTWSGLCVSLFGLAQSDSSSQNDPCATNPCAEKTGTVCVPDIKQCIREPCRQFKCVDVTTTVGQAVNQGKNEYGKCVAVFRTFDVNQDRALSYKEFADGTQLAKAQGTIPRDFKVKSAWKKMDKTPAGHVDIYEFIHLCVALTSGEADPLASAKEECWDVYTHFDHDQSQDISQREFLRGMRRARRQGHLAQDMDIPSLWRRLPKNAQGNLEAGPFIDFCLSVSKGDDPKVAAADAAGASASAAEYAGALQVDYQGDLQYMNPSGVSTVGQNNGNLAFCVEAYKKADSDNDGRISLSEFKAVCTTIEVEAKCANYTDIFTKYKQTGNETTDLSAQEFVNACKGSSVAQTAGDAERKRRMAIGGQAGALAGESAGAKAGREAGERSGAFAAAATALVEEQANSGKRAANSLQPVAMEGYFT